MRLDVGNNLELAAAGPHGAAKLLVGFIGNLRGSPYRGDLALDFVHEQLVDQRGRIVQNKTARRIGQPAWHETSRCRSKPPVGPPLKPRADGASDILNEVDPYVRRLDLGALGVGGAIQIKLDLAGGGHQRDAMTFENAEIRRHSAGSRPARHCRRGEAA